MYCSRCGAQNSQDAAYCFTCGGVLHAGSSTSQTTVALRYAGFWRRFVAHIIDRVILAIPTVIVVIAFLVPAIMALVARCELHVNILSAVISFVIGCLWMIGVVLLLHLLYFVGFESSRYRATPGKMMLGIIVTDMEGRQLSFLRSLGRNLGKIISSMIFNLGYVLAGISYRKQALHDMLADCLVVMK